MSLGSIPWKPAVGMAIIFTIGIVFVYLSGNSRFYSPSGYAYAYSFTTSTVYSTSTMGKVSTTTTTPQSTTVAITTSTVYSTSTMGKVSTTTTCPSNPVRADIIVDLDAPNPKCNPVLIAKKCRDNKLAPGTIITARKKNPLSTTPIPCPVYTVEGPSTSQNAPLCTLPPECSPIAGTSLRDAQWLYCYRSYKENSFRYSTLPNGVVCLDKILMSNFLSSEPFGCPLSLPTLKNVELNCGITPGFPQFTTFSPLKKRICVADKIHQEMKSMNQKEGCDLYVCKDFSLCTRYIFGTFAGSIPDISENPNQPYCGHAWIEDKFDDNLDGTKDTLLIADTLNNRYIKCKI